VLKKILVKLYNWSLVIILGLTLISPNLLIYSKVKADVIPTSVIITLCGDGIIETGEFCDDGTNNGRYTYNIADRFCNLTCSGWSPYCGDGILQIEYGEECDDNNNVSGDGCDAVCKTEQSPPSSGGGGAVYVPPSVPTKVVLNGRAYPGSKIHILKDGEEIITTRADSKANFTKEVINITPGVYTFGLWAEDKDGMRSITYSLTFRVTVNAITTVSGIFLPPTIGIDQTVLEKGEILNIFGQTVPKIEVDVQIMSLEINEKVQSDEVGAWLLAFDTQSLEEGTHTTKAQFKLDAKEKSGFGRTLNFYIGEMVIPFEEICFWADFNQDGKVNLIDFSIFLCWWGKANLQCDLNQNGIVDLPDFSILLCCWTG